MKDGEGINQRIFMQDPWTQKTIWGLMEGGEREELGGGGKRGVKSWANCNSINKKNFKDSIELTIKIETQDVVKNIKTKKRTRAKGNRISLKK